MSSAVGHPNVRKRLAVIVYAETVLSYNTSADCVAVNNVIPMLGDIIAVGSNGGDVDLNRLVVVHVGRILCSKGVLVVRRINDNAKVEVFIIISCINFCGSVVVVNLKLGVVDESVVGLD